MRPSIQNQVLEGRAPVDPGPGEWRELASRRSGGISVRLYWHAQRDEVSVHVSDELTGEEFVIEPPKSSALAAFYHPYAVRPRL